MKISQFIQQFPQCPWCHGFWTVNASNGDTFSFVKKYYNKVSCQNCENIIGQAGKDGELIKVEMKLDQGYSLILRLKQGQSMGIPPSPLTALPARFICQTIIQHKESGAILTIDSISLDTWMQMARKDLMEQLDSYLLLI